MIRAIVTASSDPSLTGVGWTTDNEGRHRPDELCPSGCGCRRGTEDPESRECACDGPCCMDASWMEAGE